jgi:hypothetical protein
MRLSLNKKSQTDIDTINIFCIEFYCTLNDSLFPFQNLKKMLIYG